MAPQLLLLDEPFSNLDIPHKKTLKSVLRDVCHRLKITCILVSHDPLDTLSWADKIIVMKDGKIVQKGPPKTIYSKPLNEYVAGLFGNYNLITSPHINIFYDAWKIRSRRKNMLIRPEDFKIVSRKHNRVVGKVTDVTYFGSYYEIEVSVGEITIIIKSKKRKVKMGEDIYISCPLESMWPIR
jgi:iron(III) transport system ATP-binding protein